MIGHIYDTLRHKAWVLWYTLKACRALLWRAVIHDLSKFTRVEMQGYSELRKALREAEYGSDEYNQAMEALKPVLICHFLANSHHPEHYTWGIQEMSPLDRLEMIIDWASSARSRSEELRIDVNQYRYNIHKEQLSGLLRDAKEVGLIK